MNQAPGFPAPPPMTHARRFDVRWTSFDRWLARSIGQAGAVRDAGDPADGRRSEEGDTVTAWHALALSGLVIVGLCCALAAAGLWPFDGRHKARRWRR